MKKFLFKYSKNLLCAAIALSWWFPANYPCLLFLGEYPYPQKDE